MADTAIRTELFDAARECDEAARALSLALERRNAAIRAAMGANLVQPIIGQKHLHRLAVDRALCAYGLHMHASLFQPNAAIRTSFTEAVN